MPDGITHREYSTQLNMEISIPLMALQMRSPSTFTKNRHPNTSKSQTSFATIIMKLNFGSERLIENIFIMY